MATMSMMKKALHMGRSDTERAARIFLDDSRRPKSRTTRTARRMLMGKSRGPSTIRDIRTTPVSKSDHGLVAKSRKGWDRRLSRSSIVKTTVKTVLRSSSSCLVAVGLPLGWNKYSLCICTSAAETQKFWRIGKAGLG